MTDHAPTIRRRYNDDDEDEDTDQQRAWRRRAFDVPAFFATTSPTFWKKEAYKTTSNAPSEGRRNEPSLLRAMQHSLIWIMNYLLVMQVNKHITSVNQSHKFLKLTTTMMLLTFSTAAIENMNGRFVLMGFLLLMNFLIYFNAQEFAQPDNTRSNNETNKEDDY
jgi:hypothetical protein